MKLFKVDMNEELATHILSWQYEQPYDFYNNEVTDENVEELVDGSYSAIVTEGRDIIGFFCVGKSAQVPAGEKAGMYADNFIDMGLGMNPQMTGEGNGFEFCTFILQCIGENDQDTPIRLTVATFNQRAIHLYEKLGFHKKGEFSNGVEEFLVMVKC